jgi:hypothetical protein
MATSSQVQSEQAPHPLPAKAACLDLATMRVHTIW